jgi:hypothetical protein
MNFAWVALVRLRSPYAGGAMADPMQTKVLYHGDTLDILRRCLPDAAIDLVYLDPQFKSRRRVAQC